MLCRKVLHTKIINTKQKPLATFSNSLALLRWSPLAPHFRFQPPQMQLRIVTLPDEWQHKKKKKKRASFYSGVLTQADPVVAQAEQGAEHAQKYRSHDRRWSASSDSVTVTLPSCPSAGRYDAEILVWQRGRAHWLDAARTGLPAPGWDSPVMWKSGVTSPDPGISESKSDHVAFTARGFIICSWELINNITNVLINRCKTKKKTHLRQTPF